MVRGNRRMGFLLGVGGFDSDEDVQTDDSGIAERLKYMTNRVEGLT